jgi:hypothetical protein
MSEPPAQATTEPARPAPLVIHVRPPKAPIIDFAWAGFALFILLALGVIPAVGFGGWWSVALIALLAANLIIVCWTSWRKHRAFNRTRAAFVERHAEWARNPVAVALERQWYFLSRPPGVEKVRAVLEREEVVPTDRAVVVCMGALHVPAVGAVQFEPEIMRHERPETPGQSRHWLLALLVIALVVPLGWYIFPRVSAPPHLIWIAIALVALGVWFWRYAVRPTYVRTAPGIIQVLQFGFRGRTPRIRDYTMSSGTLVVIAEAVNQLSLTVVRGDTSNSTLIRKDKHFEATMERLWAALLSTAPTPPLSDEELVG